MSNPLDAILSDVKTDATPDTSLSYEAFGIPSERGNQLESDVFDAVHAALRNSASEDGTVRGNWATVYKDHAKPLAKNEQEALFCALVFGQVRMQIRIQQSKGEASNGIMQLMKLMSSMSDKKKKD